MEDFSAVYICKYCEEQLQYCHDEGLQCEICKSSVHIRCLKRGTVPGGFNGDLFFKFICQECSDTNLEIFTRIKLSWLQTIHLTLYHLLTKSSGLSRNGFFHWRNHVVKFIDKNWDILYTMDVKQKKKWMGTVAGRLSYYSNYLFVSGAKSSLNQPAWWTLMYPKLSPIVTSNLYNIMNLEKSKAKPKTQSDAEFFQIILEKYIKDPELIQPLNITKIEPDDRVEFENHKRGAKRKINVLPPSFAETPAKVLMKLGTKTLGLNDDINEVAIKPNIRVKQENDAYQHVEKNDFKGSVKLLDPMCYYNTSLNSIARMKSEKLQVKLLGGLRVQPIHSPYSGNYLKPFIRRDSETVSQHLKLMEEILRYTNRDNADYVLPPRSCLDYVYVQPEHIPAINSLCNNFFWPGIDLTESLQYPDFSCVVLYKRLIVGFAFLVPDVNHTENYISFVFVRPGWRNCGIAKYMIYHLIQTSLGKDVTLHVSVNNPALLIYQKFGFKVENFVQNFYDKYYRNDVNESKHAFFCRLER